MKKVWKNILAITVSLTMILSMGMYAFAQSVKDSSSAVSQSETVSSETEQKEDSSSVAKEEEGAESDSSDSAQDDSELHQVEEFQPLAPEIAYQTVGLGCSLEETVFPNQLGAVVNGQETQIEDVAWNTLPEKQFNSDVAGEYVFCAVLPEEYTLTGDAVLPQIVVSVGKQQLGMALIERVAPFTGTEITIPDANFEQAIREKIGKTSGEPILDTDVADIDILDVSHKNIASLTGIEYFTMLQILDCSNNNLTSLDLTGLRHMNFLNCSFNTLGASGIAGLADLVNLKNLDCQSCGLTSLDLSAQVSLKYLYAQNNEIASINVSNLARLEVFLLTNNLLTGDSIIGLADLNNLEYLQVAENNILRLDATIFPKLRYLECNENEMTYLDVTNLDYLEELIAYNNNLTDSSFVGVSTLEKLFHINVYGNNLTKLDIAMLPLLKYIYCSSNNIEELNVQGLANVEILECDDNYIATLDITGVTQMNRFLCSENNMLSESALIGFHGNPAEYQFYPQNDYISSCEGVYGNDVSYQEIQLPQTGGPAAIKITTNYGIPSNIMVAIFGYTAGVENAAPTYTGYTDQDGVAVFDIPSVTTGSPDVNYMVKVWDTSQNGVGEWNWYTTSIKVSSTFSYVPATLAGSSAVTVNQGHTSVEVVGFTVNGFPGPKITLDAGAPPQVRWNYTSSSLEVSPGIAPGTYPIVLTASNGPGTYAVANVTLTVNPALGITGDSEVWLAKGYSAAQSSAFTTTGAGNITVHKTNGVNSITWNDTSKKLEIAPGLDVGTYPVVLEVANQYPGTSTYNVNVYVVPQLVLDGPVSAKITHDYVNASIGDFILYGGPAKSVHIVSADSKITWDDVNKTLDIATGLVPGTYPVTLRATDGVSPDLTFEFTLYVLTNFLEEIVTYDGNGAPVDPKVVYVVPGENYWTIYNEFVFGGYNFIGWNTEKDGSGTLYLEDETFVVTHAVTLYAQWEYDPAQWSTITFKSINDADGTLDGTTVFKGVKGSSTAHVTLPKLIATYGYQFEKWSVATIARANATFAEVDATSATIIVPTVFPDTDIVIYAHWMPENQAGTDGQDGSGSRVPKTGDETQLLAWVLLSMLSCTGFAALLVSKNRRRKNRWMN